MNLCSVCSPVRGERHGLSQLRWFVVNCVLRTKTQTYLREEEDWAVAKVGKVLLLRSHNLRWHSFLSNRENEPREGTEINTLQDYYRTGFFCS